MNPWHKYNNTNPYVFGKCEKYDKDLALNILTLVQIVMTFEYNRITHTLNTWLLFVRIKHSIYNSKVRWQEEASF